MLRFTHQARARAAEGGGGEEGGAQGTGSLRQANASIKITLGLRECS